MSLYLNKNNHVVIMAGGVGSRFWPLSTSELPKQFIDILGCGKTLIQLTVDRFKDICSINNIWVVTNANYVELVEKQVPQIPINHILAEPVSRNTAPCIAWACWNIKKENPNANVVVTPSDTVVMDSREFSRVINNALDFTSKNNVIVTIGIKPSRPEVGYGYVETTTTIQGEILSVLEFKEKPDLKTAERYLNRGNYLWNAGIFVWNVDTMVNSITKYKSELAEYMENIIQTNNIKEIFPKCEKISLDYAIMEPASKEGLVYSYPADFGWSDLGNWASLHDKLEKDSKNNGVVGNVTLFECSNCIVHTKDLNKVVLQGLDGYIISEKKGRLLICEKNQEQRIREFNKD